jgi:hypothetical protein
MKVIKLLSLSINCEILGFHGGEDSSRGLLGYDYDAVSYYGGITSVSEELTASICRVKQARST